MIKNFRNEPFGAWVTPEISAVSVWVSVDLPKGLLKFELHWTDGEFGTGRGPWFRSPQSPPNCRLAEWFNPPPKKLHNPAKVKQPSYLSNIWGPNPPTPKFKHFAPRDRAKPKHRLNSREMNGNFNPTNHQQRYHQRLQLLLIFGGRGKHFP